MRCGPLVLLAFFAAVPAAAQLVPDAAIDCPQCTAWNAPQEPFRIFGDTYYVGTAELSAILIEGAAGLVLLDAALPQSTPLIDRNIAALGFKTADIRLIVNSHTHFDHAGGIAAMQRASGATVASSERSAEALRVGRPNADDPQFTIANNGFPAVRDVRVIRDRETLTVGNVQVTAHFTPGHTPGGTTWTWRSCEAARCVDIVYADSLNAVSADEFRFSDAPATVAGFERSIREVESLPCDVLLSPHPGFFGMQDKVKRSAAGEADVFVTPNACRAYASAARTRLEQRLAQERAAAL